MHPSPKRIVCLRCALVALLSAFLFLTGTTMAAEVPAPTRLDNFGLGSTGQPVQVPNAGGEQVKIGADGRALYFCQLKVYVVEPVSRYRDSEGHNYEFGFLDFAIDTALNLEYQVPFNKTVSWDPAQNGVGNISSDNIKVVAVLFNHMEGFQQYSYIWPGDPVDDPFTAYLADASAAAEPGETGYNETTGGYTHSVFLEEATWDG